jgi:HK97 gp10 family phage protein
MYRSRLPQIAAELGIKMRAAENAAAQVVAQRARDRAPVATGKLRDAIHVENDPDGALVVAGNDDVFYGTMVEHGTARNPPHPFLVPAAEESRGEVQKLARALLRGL